MLFQIWAKKTLSRSQKQAIPFVKSITYEIACFLFFDIWLILIYYYLYLNTSSK